jgi:hypothetical protein
MKSILEILSLIAIFALLTFLISPEDTAYRVGSAIYAFQTAIAGG